MVWKSPETFCLSQKKLFSKNKERKKIRLEQQFATEVWSSMLIRNETPVGYDWLRDIGSFLFVCLSAFMEKRQKSDLSDNSIETAAITLKELFKT